MGISRDAFFLLNDGTVKAFGTNGFGELGIGIKAKIKYEYDLSTVSGLSGVKQLATGIKHTIALLSDGTVKGCGSNAYGQLGDGTTTDQYSFVAIPGLANVKQVAVGFDHSIFLLNDGTVKVCGFNSAGQLGDGTTTDQHTPILLPGITGVSQVAAGSNWSIFLLKDGTVKVCGFNQNGELGIENYNNQLLPVSTKLLSGVKQVSAGRSHSLFLLNNGTVMACGSNNHGELGNGTNGGKTSLFVIPNLSAVKQVSAGGYFSAFLLEDGTVEVCGYNCDGQLGINTLVGQNKPLVVSGVSNVKQICACDLHIMYLLNDGTVKECGGNLSNTDITYPRVITNLSNVIALPETMAEDTISGNEIKLVASAGDSEVTLSWTLVARATGYNVKRAITAGGSYNTIASNVAGASYIDKDVKNGTTYYYVVTAIDSNSIESSNSNEVSAKPPVSAPTNLTAAAGDSQVSLAWNVVDGATEYNINCSLTAGGPYTMIASNVKETSYIDTTAINGTTYYYVVTAISGSDESGNSNEASATPKAVMPPPSTAGNALLRVTMLDSSEREYRLATTEVNSFVSWYNQHTVTDTTSYAINDSVDESKEYLSFDKIISFKVIPLAK